MEDNCGSVNDGELVVASGQTTPLLEQVEATFDNVATPVIDRVERGWATTTGTPAFTVPGLIGRFGNHRDNAASTQMPADRAGGIRLVAPDAVGTSTCPTAAGPPDPQMPHQVREHRCIPGLPWADQSDQRPAVAIDEVVHFRAPAAAGATDRMIKRLGEQIRVVRPIPLWGG